VITLQGAAAQAAALTQSLYADVQGFSLHAAVRCGADERQRLEQLCCYITRPALVDERVRCNAAGHGALKLKTPSRGIDKHLVTSPVEFVQRLAVLWCHVHIADGGLKGVTVERNPWGIKCRYSQYRNGSTVARCFRDRDARQ